ncbi:MAG: 6-pyruvoyl trahydropterin synthase family protein [Planctomycetota bacterium]
MYTLFVDMGFRAAHQLSFSDGSQEPLHEHDWRVRVAVASQQLNKDEVVMDFEEIKCLGGGVLQGFRGQRLESLGIFEHRNVSAETVARVVYDELAPQLPDVIRLDFVEITEAPGCCARYTTVK